MRTARVLRCTVCRTLWRAPLPPSRVNTEAEEQQEPPESESEVTLVPVADRRRSRDRRSLGFGGRRADDQKRPVADPGKRASQSRKKSKS